MSNSCLVRKGEKIDERLIYKKGVHLYYSSKYDDARKCFNLLVHDSNYKEQSIVMLANIDIHEGKYEEARKRLAYCNSDDSKQLLATIENNEYNFKRSLNILRKLEVSDENEYHIAITHLNMGNLSKARKSFEKISFKDKYYMNSIIYLVVIDILDGKIEDANELLSSINRTRMSKEGNFNELYLKTLMLISYFFGDNLSNYNSRDVIYFKNVLLGSNEEMLITHIKDHMIRKHNEVVFRSDIDIHDILCEARSKIRMLNPIYSNIMSIYKFNFDAAVGYLDEKEVRGISVVVPTGTDKIVTMYPTDFSHEFDKEGYSRTLK